MKSHLKVKVHAMSTEMTYIRRMEDKWKARAKIARQRGKDEKYQKDNFWSLREHRKGMKHESRTTHLAYGCMRGIAYARMENICYGVFKGYGTCEPYWSKIAVMVERFSKDEPNPQDFMQRYSQWEEEAKKWYDGNKARIQAVTAARAAHRQRLANDADYQAKRKMLSEAVEKLCRLRYKDKQAQSGIAQSGSAVGS